MGLFPETPTTVLQRISDLKNGTDESAWERFSELYRPAIREYVRITSPVLPESDMDDVVQDVFARLVTVFRQQAFKHAKGRFHAYLSAIVRRILIDRARRLAIRFDPSKAVSIEDDDGLVVSETPSAAVLADLNWRIARHQAAVAHVFAKSALGEQARRIYVMSQTEGLTAAEIGRRLGLKANAVRAIRSRVAKMISAIEGEYE